MTNVIRLFALLCFLAFGSSLALAAGSDDHHHDTDEATTEEAVVEEIIAEETMPMEGHDLEEEHHDNADGHHDEITEGHHDDTMNNHHDEPLADHHDEMTASDEHDHSAHEEGTWATTALERTFAWIGKFHPAATNFPIGLILAAFFAEALFMLTGKTTLRSAARYCLWIGALTAAGTAVLGWGFVGFDTAGDDSILAAHRWNGTSVGVLALITLWLGERTFNHDGSAALYRLGLLVTAALVAFNGYLGGKMVYGADHYAWPIS